MNGIQPVPEGHCTFKRERAEERCIMKMMFVLSKFSLGLSIYSDWKENQEQKSSLLLTCWYKKSPEYVHKALYCNERSDFKKTLLDWILEIYVKFLEVFLRFQRTQAEFENICQFPTSNFGQGAFWQFKSGQLEP